MSIAILYCLILIGVLSVIVSIQMMKIKFLEEKLFDKDIELGKLRHQIEEKPKKTEELPPMPQKVATAVPPPLVAEDHEPPHSFKVQRNTIDGIPIKGPTGDPFEIQELEDDEDEQPNQIKTVIMSHIDKPNMEDVMKSNAIKGTKSTPGYNHDLCFIEEEMRVTKFEINDVVDAVLNPIEGDDEQ